MLQAMRDHSMFDVLLSEYKLIDQYILPSHALSVHIRDIFTKLFGFKCHDASIIPWIMSESFEAQIGIEKLCVIPGVSNIKELRDLKTCFYPLIQYF